MTVCSGMINLRGCDRTIVMTMRDGILRGRVRTSRMAKTPIKSVHRREYLKEKNKNWLMQTAKIVLVRMGARKLGNIVRSCCRQRRMMDVTEFQISGNGIGLVRTAKR